MKDLEEKLGNKIPALQILPTGVSLRITQLRETLEQLVYLPMCISMSDGGFIHSFSHFCWAITLYRNCFRYLGYKAE